ncbi:hypothetical protein ACCO45_011623 [Purpureocillium lilacinum]|uniref:Uncharacterized protein n=1 Tax=Purpureocillium lilacinum TaxID=33203 RepID=A0ACC4DBZ3_PURLI
MRRRRCQPPPTTASGHPRGGSSCVQQQAGSPATWMMDAAGGALAAHQSLSPLPFRSSRAVAVQLARARSEPPVTWCQCRRPATSHDAAAPDTPGGAASGVIWLQLSRGRAEARAEEEGGNSTRWARWASRMASSV